MIFGRRSRQKQRLSAAVEQQRTGNVRISFLASLAAHSLAAKSSVVVNYNTRFKSRPIFPQPIKSFFLMDILVAAVRLLALLRSRHWLLEFASRSSDLHEDPHAPLPAYQSSGCLSNL